MRLGRADYTEMPWANGKGRTVELWREDGPQGLRFRLSMASVVEDGDFSLFPGIDRVLTVLSGPGFGLVGDGIDLRCDLLVPAAFPGDVALRAVDVTAPVEDFNVMTARDLPAPEVRVVQAGQYVPPQGGRLFVFDLASQGLEISEAPVTASGPSLLVLTRF
ncbi:HutD family protein [Gemmobacter lutimaris]|uniref:HutD family protein n=1 Tax=Gemmobacter lutimaris TaxID=2306023 RepID=A0A398BJU9_9RHOB|nr:HutD family protein [Gemmobacter lutimaris]RID90785.1 HutD family protein [Gemmobacter lutimaris]